MAHDKAAAERTTVRIPRESRDGGMIIAKNMP